MDNEINSGDLLFIKKRTITISPLTFVPLFMLLAVLILIYFFTILPISGTSMEYTLHDGQYCLFLRNHISVERGDVVTLNTAAANEESHILVKRVIGTGGDRIIFMATEDRNYVDLYICKSGENKFTMLNEGYIKERMKRSSSTYSRINLLKYTENLTELDINDANFAENYPTVNNAIITVPPNHIYFMGDNRNNSRDSRYYGTRDLSAITGKLLYRF